MPNGRIEEVIGSLNHLDYSDYNWQYEDGTIFLSKSRDKAKVIVSEEDAITRLKLVYDASNTRFEMAKSDWASTEALWRAKLGTAQSLLAELESVKEYEPKEPT